MEEDDASLGGMSHDVLANGFGVFVAPILGVDIPQDNALLELGRNLVHGAVGATIRRAEKFDALASNGLEGIGGALEVVEHG